LAGAVPAFLFQPPEEVVLDEVDRKQRHAAVVEGLEDLLGVVPSRIEVDRDEL